MKIYVFRIPFREIPVCCSDNSVSYHCYLSLEIVYQAATETEAFKSCNKGGGVVVYKSLLFKIRATLKSFSWLKILKLA